MRKHMTGFFLAAAFVGFLSLALLTGTVAATEEETILGTVLKNGKGFVIETDDGDYLVRGKDLSRLVGKLVEATGIVIETPKGDIIEVKSVEELEKTQPE